MSDKDTGSFYTPISLINYMVSYIRTRSNPKSILEPSAGDGRFARPLQSFHAPITLVESEAEKVDLLRQTCGDACRIYGGDFIAFALQEKVSYDLIIGNPPYIAKKNVVKEQTEASRELVKSFGLEKGIFQNLWVSFVLASIKVLSQNGSIFFVLPFEFLQVQYAEKLRGFLEKRFNTIEIITFKERVFDEIEQDICLVYMTNEAEAKPYIQYTTLPNAENTEPLFQSKIMRNKPLMKWSNCIINDVETERLGELAAKFPKVSSFGEISPGIVTGANSFFILSRADIDRLRVPESNVLPVITKSSAIPRLLYFKGSDFDGICGGKNRTHMLSLSGLDAGLFPAELKRYIAGGEAEGIHKRYKCAKRKRWYDVPVVKKGDACFFKRYDSIPRVIMNCANVHTTDIIYNIRFDSRYDPASFVFCFYNSLTLALCEYNGRFYGGGVEELVPSEFKGLAVPYKKIRKPSVDKLDRLFREKKSIGDIIDYVDRIVLSRLRPDEIAFLQNVRKRYLDRRLKNT